MKISFTKLALAVTLVAFAGYIYFNPPRGKEAVAPPATTTTDKNICMDYDSEKMSMLDADLIHEMTRDYRSHQLDYIQRTTGSSAPSDAYSIWFNLVTLKKFIYHIEKNALKGDASITDDKLGLRIYYAAYPNKKEIEKKKFKDLDFILDDPNYQEYGGLHTLVMIPTIMDAKGNDVDFNPLDKTTFSGGFAQDSKYSYGSTSPLPDDTAALTATPSRDMSGRNHGVLYPPTGIVVPASLGF